MGDPLPKYLYATTPCKNDPCGSVVSAEKKKMNTNPNYFTKIPSINEIDICLKQKDLPSGKQVRALVNEILNQIKSDVSWLQKKEIQETQILQRIQKEIKSQNKQLVSLVNATGTIIHTNLGRSVFSKSIWDAAGKKAQSYTNLEYSLETGKRGGRMEAVGILLKELTGAEDVVLVNNNAAAILLALSSTLDQGEIIISRGELVEIGGSFRIPDIIALSGGKLKEVGTTNRTHLKDYEQAISKDTKLILKVHTSNYEIVGFKKEVDIPELKKLSIEKKIPLMEDAGTGVLKKFHYEVLNSQDTVRETISKGVDILTFSGDKLLGGPQAGLILGRNKYLEKMKKHPLYRVLRVDKITMFLLEETLLLYLNNEDRENIVTQKILNQEDSLVKSRGESLLAGLNQKKLKLVTCKSTPGGGTYPRGTLPSWAIQIEGDENRILQNLRNNKTPIIGRVVEGKAILDCRTILSHQLDIVKQALSELFL